MPLFLHLQNGLARPTLVPRNTDTLVMSPLLFTPLRRVGLLWLLLLQVFFSLKRGLAWPGLFKPKSILESRILSGRGSAPPQGLCTYGCLCLGQKHSTRKQRKEGGRRGIQGSRTGLVARDPCLQESRLIKGPMGDFSPAPGLPWASARPSLSGHAGPETISVALF